MAATLVPFSSDNTPDVQGVLHLPSGSPNSALVLSHGAGSNYNAPVLVKVAEAFSDVGIAVLRMNLPFRQRRPHGPPGPGDAERDRAGIASAILALRQRGHERVFAGGHSYGGRQTSMLAAEQPDLVSGLLLLSYPLHPPRRPEQARTAHFPKLTTQAVFVHGTRDPFATPDELKAALDLIPARTTLIEIEGAGHELSKKKEQGLSPALLRDLVSALVG